MIKTMRIYISGKITGLPFPEVEARFYDAQDLLETLDFEVVNPLDNGLTQEHSWNEHMVRDIDMLLGCKAIYMLDNWHDSKGANIEYHIACTLGMDVWFESNVVRNKAIVKAIQNAIHHATDFQFNHYATKSKRRELFFCRMLFAWHCDQNGLEMADIARYLKRDRTTISHSIETYKTEIKYNPEFKLMAERVDEILKENKN